MGSPAVTGWRHAGYSGGHASSARSARRPRRIPAGGHRLAAVESERTRRNLAPKRCTSPGPRSGLRSPRPGRARESPRPGWVPTSSASRGNGVGILAFVGVTPQVRPSSSNPPRRSRSRQPTSATSPDLGRHRLARQCRQVDGRYERRNAPLKPAWRPRATEPSRGHCLARGDARRHLRSHRTVGGRPALAGPRQRPSADLAPERAFWAAIAHSSIL